MTAPLALCILLSAIEPLASTKKITKAPAFFWRSFALKSFSSIIIVLLGFFNLLDFWYGAAALRVASTAILFTLPLGIKGLTYLPLLWLRITDLLPLFPALDFADEKSNKSGSTIHDSGSRINSSGISGVESSSPSELSCSSSWLSSFSLDSGSESSLFDWGGGGLWSSGGGGWISSSWGGIWVALGRITNLTATFKSSELTFSSPLRAAFALATFTANNSDLCPSTPPLRASFTK